MQGTVTKGFAAFHAFSATNTKFFLHGVFIKGIFYIFPFQCVCGTELVFGGRIQLLGFGFEITTAEVAVTTHHIGMGAFHS